MYRLHDFLESKEQTPLATARLGHRLHDQVDSFRTTIDLKANLLLTSAAGISDLPDQRPVTPVPVPRHQRQSADEPL